MPLSDDELVAVLEDSARRGSAEAAQALLARRRRRERADAERDDGPLIDPMTWLHPDEMAALTEEQRQRAREAFVAHYDAHPPSWQTAQEWQAERALILSGTWDVQPAEDRWRASGDRDR